MSLDAAPAPLPLATSAWDEREYEAIRRIVDGGRFTMGPAVAEFERVFADRFGARHAVMVNSGSSANLLMVATAVLNEDVELAAGDEVLVTAVSWATTYYPLAQYGLVPRFVDIDPDTLNVDLDELEGAIGPRVRAVLAVNLLGNPNDFSRLVRICEERSLVLLEDNCEALGAEQDGRFAGTFGLMGTFSAFFSHHISTMEGGVVLTDDDRCHQMLVSLRAHGWTRELPERNLVHDKTGDAFDDLFRFVLPGYNVRPLELSGAIGIEQVAKVSSILEGRRENARVFAELMADVPDVRLQREIGTSSWFGFSLLLEGPLAARRREVVAALTAAGVESRPIVAGNFTRNPVMRHLNGVVPDALPGADAVHESGLFVGNHDVPVPGGLRSVREVLASVPR